MGIIYKSKFLLALAAAAVLCFLYPPACPAQPTSGNLEDDVKAAYVLNIMKFVDWEARKIPADGAIKIGLAGSDPICDVLEKMSGNKIGGRPLVFGRLKAESADMGAYNLIFIAHSETPRLEEILKKLKGAAILTVSDIPDFAKKNGMIGFFIENERVKIEINMNEVKRAGFKLGAKLLEVAKLIK